MIDPEILAVSERCKKNGTQMSEEDFAGIVDNPEFNSRLEACVR
jgi:hypothetical protein